MGMWEYRFWQDDVETERDKKEFAEAIAMLKAEGKVSERRRYDGSFEDVVMGGLFLLLFTSELANTHTYAHLILSPSLSSSL